MLSLADLEHAMDQIEKTLEKAGYGWRNEAALRSIQAQVFIIRMGRSDPYTMEKLATILSDADILYSPHKAAKQGGSERVQAEMLNLCQRIRSQAKWIDAQ